MHFSIPDTQECREDNGATYIAYNIHINGVFHCTVRYRQLHSLHEQLKKDLGGSTLPTFPPKKLLALSPVQTEERRISLEKYILQLSQDARVLNNDVFNGFLVSAQNETQRSVGGWQDEVPIDVYLMSGKKVTLNVPATLQTDDLLEKVCSHIHLPNELVYYFALFLVKKEENDLVVVKRLQDFESPYISQRFVKGKHRIMLRKNYWDERIDEIVTSNQVGLNLVYAQTVHDVEKGWILTNHEIQRQLAALQAKGAKKEYLDIGRSLKYYGYLRFQRCICDFPTPNTTVLITAGNKELNFRIECEDGSLKEGNFKVTRMKCWRITVQQQLDDYIPNNSSNSDDNRGINNSNSRIQRNTHNIDTHRFNREHRIAQNRIDERIPDTVNRETERRENREVDRRENRETERRENNREAERTSGNNREMNREVERRENRETERRENNREVERTRENNREMNRATDERRMNSGTSDGTRNINLELSFEYLMSRDEMRWITVASSQAVLMSMCLQGMVHELLSHKRGYKVRTPGERIRKGSLSYMRRDGSSTRITLNHTGESLSVDGTTTQSPIGELSLRRLSERLNDLHILPHQQQRQSRQHTQDQATVENDAFNILGDDIL